MQRSMGEVMLEVLHVVWRVMSDDGEAVACIRVCWKMQGCDPARVSLWWSCLMDLAVPLCAWLIPGFIIVCSFVCFYHLCGLD